MTYEDLKEELESIVCTITDSGFYDPQEQVINASAVTVSLKKTLTEITHDQFDPPASVNVTNRNYLKWAGIANVKALPKLIEYLKQHYAYGTSAEMDAILADLRGKV